MSASLRLEHDAPLPYLLSLPDDNAAHLRPVLVFLHGYDEGAPMDIHEALTRHGPLRAGNPAETLNKFIIVAPQMPVRGDLWPRYADAVWTILRRIVEQHAGDPQRAYLTGFSFGGNGVFDLALLQPNTWAALWAVDPTRVPDRDPKAPVWLSFGEVARFQKRRFIQALGLRSADQADALRVYLDEGKDHVGSARLAYQDDRIYSWLLAQRLRAS